MQKKGQKRFFKLLFFIHLAKWDIRSCTRSHTCVHWLQLRCNQAALPGGQRRRHKGNSRGQTSDGTLLDPRSAAHWGHGSQSASACESCKYLVRVNMSSLINPPTTTPPPTFHQFCFLSSPFCLCLSSLVFFPPFKNSADTIKLQLPQNTRLPWNKITFHEK